MEGGEGRPTRYRGEREKRGDQPGIVERGRRRGNQPGIEERGRREDKPSIWERGRRGETSHV